MKSKETDEYWDDILEKFSKHQGTIVSFCRKHNVNIHRLYHRRKKLLTKPKPTFHAINLNDNSAENDIANNVENNPTPSSEIRIEIGKTKLYITNIDKISLSNVIKEIMSNC